MAFREPKNKVKINILSIRPPQTSIILTGYKNEPEINCLPIRASVPSLTLFYVPTVVRIDLESRGYEVNINYIDLASENPTKLSSYVYPYDKNQQLSYGNGTIKKYLRGEELSTLDDRLKDIDVCLISSPMVTDSIAVTQTIQTIKQINSEIIVLVGGRDVQSRSEWYLKHGADFACLGCAEHSVSEAIHKIISDKILKKSNQKIIPRAITSLSKDSLLEEEVLPYFDNGIIQRYNRSCEGRSPKGVESPYMWFRTSVGCFNNCDFCPSANSLVKSLNTKIIDILLQHYKKSGIRSLLNCDDNFLARLKHKSKSSKENEQEIIEIMNLIRGYGFAHEFANGLQIKLLIDENGKIRDRLIEELFKYEFNNNHFSGTYRMYWPHETLIKRGEYQKLVKEKDNYKTLDAVLQTGIPEIVFNTIIFSHYNQQDIELLDQKTEEFCNWMNKHNRSTKWSLAFFHELPLPGSKKYTELIQRSFDINKHPELWAVSFNPTNGKFFTYDQLYDLKLKLMRKYDSVTLDSWITKGEYLCH